VVEVLLPLLLRQAALLSVAVLLLAAVRPWLLKHLGAGLAYAAWLLVPLLLLTPALPRPAHEPLHVWLEPTLPASAPTLPVMPQAAAGQAWPAWLLGLWLAGALAVAGVQVRRQWRLPGQVLPAGSSPALVGLLRPRVLLPADFTARFGPAQQALILAHEAVHEARGDNAWRLLACALCSLHWWNPIAWWGARLMQADQELACDAAVLARNPGKLQTYSEALLAAHGLNAPDAPLASRWGSTHPLIERLAMLERSHSSARLGLIALASLQLTLASVAYATQPDQALNTSGTEQRIRLDLVMAVQDGKWTRRTAVALVGKDGEPLRVAMKPSEREPALQAIQLDITPHATGGGNLRIEAKVLRQGDSALLLYSEFSGPSGKPALMEKVQPELGERASVFVVGHLLPAGTDH
jgi:beta-lactamase regulating signal transducer with metallopeptidase domain